MSNNNYLDEVYTVGENNRDHREDISGDDSDRDQRRGGKEFYDAISDPAVLRNAMDPISEQVKSANLTQTPIFAISKAAALAFAHIIDLTYF